MKSILLAVLWSVWLFSPIIAPAAEPLRVEIATKYVAIPQKGLDEAHIQWLFEGNCFSNSSPSVATGNFARVVGILNNPAFGEAIKTLALKPGSDVLNAPSTTSLSGQIVQSKIADEFIYSTGNLEPKVDSAGGQLAITPTIPNTNSFRTVEVGSFLTITPTVREDSRSIRLMLIPKITDFFGFQDSTSTNTRSVNTVTGTVTNQFHQPVFSTQSSTTTVTVCDGQTVVLGGIVTTGFSESGPDEVISHLEPFGGFYRARPSGSQKREFVDLRHGALDQ